MLGISAKMLPDAATMESKVGPSVAKATNIQENKLQQIYKSNTFHHNTHEFPKKLNHPQFFSS